MKPSLTFKVSGIEADVLESMVKKGLFDNKQEAVRSALIHYSLELGLMPKSRLWEDIQKFPRRKISQEQLKKDLMRLEDEA